MKPMKFDDISDKIISLRNENILLDSDVAEIYGVDTNEINQAVKRNPRKFPNNRYIIELTASEKQEVITNCDKPKLKFSPALPKAFTEKGLYMLATILKSEKAEQATIDIIETFAKIRELSRTWAELNEDPEEERQKSLMAKTGTLLAELLDDGLKPAESETSIELNLALLKVKRTVKRTKK